MPLPVDLGCMPMSGQEFGDGARLPEDKEPVSALYSMVLTRTEYPQWLLPGNGPGLVGHKQQAHSQQAGLQAGFQEGPHRFPSPLEEGQQRHQVQAGSSAGKGGRREEERQRPGPGPGAVPAALREATAGHTP